MAAQAAYQEQKRVLYSRCTTQPCSLVFPVIKQFDGYIHKHCCSTCRSSAGRLHTHQCFWNTDHHVLNAGNEQGNWWTGNEQGNWWTDEQWRDWYAARALRRMQQYAPQ
jgi:hypothetical protein